jgi:glycosyltransferase involved in cell wall biosynthesis
MDVTVVLPTRDRWQLAEQALASVLDQRGVGFEVCVIDDGSRTQAPPGFDKDRRVRLFRHDHPAGVAASRNRGIREARAEWIAFLDDDDVWAPWHLQRLLRAARERRAHWAFGRFVVTDLRRRVLREGPRPVEGDGFERRLLTRNSIGLSSSLVATEAVRAIGGFDENLAVMADWDLWLRLAAESPPAVSDTVSVAYASHENGMSLDMDRVRAERPYIASRNGSLIARCGVPFADDGSFWRWLAAGYASQGRHWDAARYYLKAAAKDERGRNVVRAIGALPGVGVPLRLRRRILASGLRRTLARPPANYEHAWLRRFSVPKQPPRA